MDETVELLLSTALFVATIMAIAFMGSVAAVAAVPMAIGYGIYWHTTKSPTARERQASERTWALFKSVNSKFTSINIPTFIGDRLGYPDDADPNSCVRFDIALQLTEFEGLDTYPPEPPALCDTIEGGRYRDFLNQVSPGDFKKRLEHICLIAELCDRQPSIDNVSTVIYTAVDKLDDGRSLLPKVEKRLDENFVFQKEVAPRDYAGDNIIEAYLKGTPLEMMADMIFDDSIEIPHDIRSRHQMLIGGTGHGKTQCLQQMLLQDFEEEDACVIVIDSQGSMLEKLLHVVSWDRIMYLDGGNIRNPLALSAFEIGSTSRPEDEPKVRTAVALYEHMFAVRETALTTTQSTLYRFLSRFLMVIPNANFDTALEILQDGYEPYAEYVDALDETSHKFITTQLCDPKDRTASQSYRTTRQEVARRLFTLMESRTLKGMFNAPESKVDIAQAIRDKRIILINTAQAVLGDEGAQLFGKYCFAQIAIEVLARPETKDRVYLYLDEAQEYLSDSPIIRRLYEQGRKRGLCMVTACQELNQLERAGIDRMMFSLTSIKFAGGVSAQDASKLAKEMDTEGETIRNVPELTFAAWIKHHGTGVYKVTPGLLEDRIAEDPEDIDTLKELMVEQYHYDPHAEEEAEEADDERSEPDEDDAGFEPETPSEPEANFEGYWDDPLPAPKPEEPDEPPKKPPPAADDDFDPDKPQELD